ncbi:MAG TPA: SBBP repeat-containing protein, partial [Verrucomicrobiae bacterium]
EFAVQPKLACSNNFYLNANSFVARVSADGTSLDYSTFLGGTNYDVGRSIYYEPIQKQVYAAGWTLSTNFPYFNGLTNCTRLDGWRTNSHPAGDGWVARFSVEGNDWPLVYSTFLGSSNYDQATGITADSTGNAYVVGWTTSTNFPVARENTNQISFTSFVHTNNTGFIVATNAFLTQIGWDETNAYVRYSQVFGSRAITVANGVALNLDGSSVYVAGYSSATNIPVSTNLLLNITNNLGGLLKSTNRGGFDVFVMAMPTDFSAIKYFTYLGGKKNDVAKGLALDYEGNAVVVGQTLSTNFPAFEPWFDSSVYPTNGVWPKTAIWSTNYPVLHHILVGTNDAFVTKIITAPSN